MELLKPRTKKAILENLKGIEGSESLREIFTALQNDISVSFNTGIVAIASVSDDSLSAAFAKAYADDFALNGGSALIIDANMYDPRLADYLGLTPNENNEPVQLGEKVSAICLKKEIYPSSVMKEGLVHNLIEAHKGNFNHIVIIAPSIKKHKDISLLSEDLDCVLLLSQRHVTKKADIFNALRYFEAEKLPLAKTILLK